MMDIEQTTDAAIELGIKLTNAEDGTEIYKCWASRVQEACNAWEDENMERCQEMIEDAEQYAI